MKTSRKIGFFTLMAVNLVLMLHAVVPHHHHEVDICFQSTHCHSDAHHSENDCDPSEGHQHHQHDDGESCTLNPSYLLSHTLSQINRQGVQKVLLQIISVEVDSIESLINHYEQPIVFGACKYRQLLTQNSPSSRLLRGPPMNA